MATHPMLPMSASAVQDSDLDYSPDNPQIEDPEQGLSAVISDDDKTCLIDTITTYRSGWAPDRLLRIPQWMKNQLMYRGNQALGWDPAQNIYFDALAWYRQSGNAQQGEDTYLERYFNNITKMSCRGFVGTLARGVPPTAVFPENAEIPSDVATAKFGQEAISIIERKNDINRLVRIEATLLFLFGMYVKVTRTVIDGKWAGYDKKPIFAVITDSKPNRYKCSRCGTENPLQQFGAHARGNPQISAGDGAPADATQPSPQSSDITGGQLLPPEGAGKQCSNCGSPLGSADFYPAEKGGTFDVVSGEEKVPRAMIRWSLHGPLEFDADPQASSLRESALKALDCEIDVGLARASYPGMADRIEPGEEISTTPNAAYEKLRRNEAYARGYGYTSDTFQERVTYSQVWLEPEAYYRLDKPDKDANGQTFADRMNDLGPEGLKVTMIGNDIVDVRPSDPSKELSVCLLQENCGLFPPAIADDVVPFNERLNDDMDIIDDYLQRCATGLTVVDETRIDRRKMSGKTLLPGVLNFLTTKGEGVNQPIANSIYQFKWELDQNAILYPPMLIDLCQKISGVTSQLQGTGTAEGVDTFHGQQLQVNLSETGIAQYWENLKAEHAQAADNAIWHLQRAHKQGLINQLWEVQETKGSEFRNNYVDLEKMNGHIRVYGKPDEGLPQSPEQKRDICKMLITEAGQGNPLAVEVMGPVPNQEIVLTTLLGSDFVLPDAVQRSRTLQHIAILMDPAKTKLAVTPQGVVPDLPVKPEIGVDDWKTLKDTISLWMRENWDQERQNPQGWQRLRAYRDLAMNLEHQEAIQDAQKKSQVAAAGGPAPDPTEMAAKKLLVADAAKAIQDLAGIADIPPAVAIPGKALPAVVSAAGKILDAGIKATQ